MKARIHVTLKNGVHDPAGSATRKALGNLGIDGINDVKIGKLIELELDAANENDAKAQVEEACKKLLANTVIENYSYELIA